MTAAVLTDGRGVPFARPEREDYPVGIEGDIWWMRAFHDYKNAVTNEANRAFEDALRRALRR